ncbi:MAG: T9SS C-terminal target domain-containing protein, partial [Crocinitomicaceae bacterium]
MKNTPKNLRLTLLIFLVCFTSNINAQITGCTDSSATNFNASATVNDGSCTYNAATISSIESWLLPSAMSESSGLIMWNDKIWTHNDDTDINIYNLDTSDITNYTAFPLTSCVNNDWEEISQDSTYIYMGDFGNNVNGNRTNLKILRIDKASFLLNSPIIDTINFSYSTQTNFTPTGSNNTDFDCEAFIVSSDSIYLFSKDWVSNKSTIYALPKTPGTYYADSISTYNVQGLITGASYLEDKHKLVLSGYSNLLQPFIVLLYDFHNHDFFSGNKRKIFINLPFTQVEGIATVDGVNYFISNESFSQTPINTPARINRINLSSYFGG